MSAAEAEAEAERDYNWGRLARPAQRLPRGAGHAWRTWLVMAGRGWGKSRTGAEALRQLVRLGAARRIVFIAPDPFGLENMVEGESGILAVSSPAERPRWRRHLRRLEWSSGAWAQGFTARAGDLQRMRGLVPDLVWGEEMGSWEREGVPGWEAIQDSQPIPTAIITTSPREVYCPRCHAPRLTWGLQRVLASPGLVLTRGATLQNRANLPRSFFEMVRSTYAGTERGRVELRAAPVPPSRACTCKEVRSLEDVRNAIEKEVGAVLEDLADAGSRR